MSPPNSSPEPQNVTLFADRVLIEVIKLDCDHIGGPYSNLTGEHKERRSGHRHADGRPCEDPGSDGHLQAKDGGLRRNNPAGTVISDFQPPELPQQVNMGVMATFASVIVVLGSTGVCLCQSV